MRQIKNYNLAQLLIQLHFTPKKKRQQQLEASEKLFAIIDKEKEYPFEFVCFRITGFRPKGQIEWDSIKGAELAEDLGIFISKLSSQIAKPVDEEEQKVYSIEDLAKKLGISTKTIHRWRKRGLIARKFLFENDTKRFGFLQSTVDEFLQANPNLVSQAKVFRRMTKQEKQAIIKRAIALAAKGTMSRYQVIEKIVSKTGKAHETVRYTLLKYEKSQPDKTIFIKPSGVIEPEKAGEIYRLYKQGSDIEELMKQFGRSKSSIYRLIKQRRARALLTKKAEFIDSNEFLEDGAEEKILTKRIITEASGNESVEPLILASSSLEKYLQTMKNTPLLTREREVELFRRYNYLKYLACITRAGLKPSRVPSTLLEKIETYLTEAEGIKKMIIEANLRLVVSIASKHTRSGANLQDLVSEGNFSLMRAVEKFDYAKGFRFTTYASWAIAKDYARKIPAEAARLAKTGAASLKDVQRDLRITEAADVSTVERTRKSLIQVIRNELNEREQYIILNHFGLIGSLVKKKKKTLKEIGEYLDLTKERIRQIELVALQKLRQSLSSEEFELLSG